MNRRKLLFGLLSVPLATAGAAVAEQAEKVPSEHPLKCTCGSAMVMQPRTIVTYPGRLSQQQIENIRKAVGEAMASGRKFILEEGMKIEQYAFYFCTNRECPDFANVPIVNETA